MSLAFRTLKKGGVGWWTTDKAAGGHALGSGCGYKSQEGEKDRAGGRRKDHCDSS